MGGYSPFPIYMRILYFKFFSLLLTTVILLAVNFYFPQAVCSQEVEIELGPEFKDSDRSVINNCVYEQLTSKAFPFDFILGELPLSPSDACPKFTFFDEDYEFCWVNQVWSGVEPALLLGLFVWAIFSL